MTIMYIHIQMHMYILAIHTYVHTHIHTLHDTYVTGFTKRGLILASNFATFKRHNFVCT